MSESTSPPDRGEARLQRPGGAAPAPSSAPQAPPQAVEAAVLVPIHGEGDQQRLILTKRRAELRRHAGEISFPGGRRDREDPDLLHTALREAEEEIGLPRRHVRIVAQLPPTSTFATGYLIHPFVGLIPPGLPWTPSPQEVEVVLDLPLAAIRASRTRIELDRRGITFETDAYELQGNVIWGATARIIQLLFEQIDSGLLAGTGAA